MEYTNFNHIIIRSSKSPANFSVDNEDYIYLKEVRFFKKYDSELPIRTETSYKTLDHPNSQEVVNLQRKKTIKHQVDVFFKENINIALLTECDNIAIVDRNGVPYNVILDSIEVEELSSTTISKAKLTFVEILTDADSLNSFVESDYIKDRIDNSDFKGKSIYLELKTNKAIDSFFYPGNPIKFYTLFYPIVFRQQIGDDKTLVKTKTGQEYTISTYNCQSITIKLFLNDENLEIFEKYFKLAYWGIGNFSFGTKIFTPAGSYGATQTINEDDRVLNENDSLINLNEIDVTIKRDFFKNELLD